MEISKEDIVLLGFVCFALGAYISFLFGRACISDKNEDIKRRDKEIDQLKRIETLALHIIKSHRNPVEISVVPSKINKDVFTTLTLKGIFDP